MSDWLEQPEDKTIKSNDSSASQEFFKLYLGIIFFQVAFLICKMPWNS